MSFTEQMEQQFGTDKALGVSFLLDTGGLMSAEDYDALYLTVGDDMPGAQSVFPDGTSAACCTDYARQICRAMPNRAVIFGFYNKDNPTSRVAREEIHPGGHDFAVVDDRYIVDPWIRLVADESDQIVFDMHDVADARAALDNYGPRACWVTLAV